MSTQTKIDESLVKYLQNVGYRKDKIIDDLEDETSKLGSVSQAANYRSSQLSLENLLARKGLSGVNSSDPSP